MQTSVPYFSLHEANQAVNDIRHRVSRIYQMNFLLKKYLRTMRIKKHDDILLDDLHQEMTIDSASSIKILLRCVEDNLTTIKQTGCKLVSLEKGIFQWPTMIGNDPAFFRWQVGQESIKEWYDPQQQQVFSVRQINASNAEPEPLS
ncbi:DUF2203 domain-containing protein [Gammaproteobacteria bacterium]|nr:DUF2203 domain-containing protein [Gammaproteobacteria bacterium]